jgi:hypothetical protein
VELISIAEDEFENKILREAGRLSQGHAEMEKISGVHVNQIKRKAQLSLSYKVSLCCSVHKA